MSSKEVLFEVATSITTDPTFRVVRSATGEIETHYDCAYPTREPGSVGVTGALNSSGEMVGLSAGGKRVGSVTLVKYTNSSGFAALPSSAEQIISDVVLIPANTVKPGDKFQFVCFSEDAGTADAVVRAVRAKVHTTADVLSGVLLSNIQIGTATNTKIAVDKVTAVTSTGEVRTTSTGSVGGLMSATAQITVSIDWTVDQYIGLCVINSNTLVNHLVYHASLTLEAAQ